MSTSLLCRKKGRFLAENRMQWTISGFFRMREEFSGQKSLLLGGNQPDTASGCCIAKSSCCQVVLLRILNGKTLMYITLYKLMGGTVFPLPQVPRSLGFRSCRCCILSCIREGRFRKIFPFVRARSIFRKKPLRLLSGNFPEALPPLGCPHPGFSAFFRNDPDEESPFRG